MMSHKLIDIGIGQVWRNRANPPVEITITGRIGGYWIGKSPKHGRYEIKPSDLVKYWERVKCPA